MYISLYHPSTHQSIKWYIQQRRLRWFGHCIRSPSNSPAAQALTLALDVSNVNRLCGSTLRLDRHCEKDIATMDLSLMEGSKVAEDSGNGTKYVVANIYSV